MAVKKSELYRTLWSSCDKLRGGMDASQYKDYVLVMLFMKYVSDRAKNSRNALIDIPEGGGFDDLVALKGKSHIGDGINKVIGKLADANELRGVIDVADFNDPSKLGNGKAMVDRLTGLIAVFENPNLDFSSNRADGDDLLGDAYEYLMMKFATESGKSKGQFYTPAEVSRIMAAVIGIDKAKSQKETIYDPTCGSGSLLLKAHDLAKSATGLDLAIYGQEMDNATAALARMNMWLHNAGTAEIENDNTLSNPLFTDKQSGGLRTFDYVVANPPFSVKSWMDGVDIAADPFGRFTHGTPPKKNGDYAFLLHILASLKSTGKGAVILPHGVLFRGNSEAEIRRNLVKQGYIKAIIGLPANLFYGTGIPACIIVLDKEGAAARDSILMVDASRGFIKSGAKNRLRERDIHLIVTTVTKAEEIGGFSRVVPVSEIASTENDYNLNLPRYVDTSESEDMQDLDAHVNGGIPNRDIDALSDYWDALPQLRRTLFAEGARPGYSIIAHDVADLDTRISESDAMSEFSHRVATQLDHWIGAARPLMLAVDQGVRPRDLVADLGEKLLLAFHDFPLIDTYAIFQAFMDFAEEALLDDAHLIVTTGWKAGSQLRALPPKEKGEKRLGRIDFTVKRTDYRSELVPASLVYRRFFSDEADATADAALQAEERLTELAEMYGGDGMVLSEMLNDNGIFTRAAVTAALKASEYGDEDFVPLKEVIAALNAASSAKKRLGELEGKIMAKYQDLSEDEILHLVVDDKWIATVAAVVGSETKRSSTQLVSRLRQLHDRYGKTVPAFHSSTVDLSARVSRYLVAMGVAAK